MEQWLDTVVPYVQYVPSCSAFSSDMIKMADAPSVRNELQIGMQIVM